MYTNIAARTITIIPTPEIIFMSPGKTDHIPVYFVTTCSRSG